MTKTEIHLRKEIVKYDDLISAAKRYSSKAKKLGAACLVVDMVDRKIAEYSDIVYNLKNMLNEIKN